MARISIFLCTFIVIYKHFYDLSHNNFFLLGFIAD